MIRTVIILLLICLSLKSRATACVDKIFYEDHLNLYLCQNYSNYHETRVLLFQARAKALNDYIVKKIKSGQLEDKKFEIQLYDAVLTYQHLTLNKGEKTYFISLSGFPTFYQLQIAIDSFAKENWKSFTTSNYQKVDSEVISKQIDDFYKDNSSQSAVFPTMTVWDLDNLKLEYVNDSLKYFIDKIELKIKSNSNLPVRIRDRFILFQKDSIFVLQGKNIIKSIKINSFTSTDFEIYTYKKWVNICDGGTENWVYSYSYDKNRFYRK